MAGGGNAFGVDDVLQSDRNAAQRPNPLARHHGRLGRACIRKCTLLGPQHEGVQFAIQLFRTLQAGARQFHRGKLLRRDQFRRFGNGGDLAHARSSSAKP